MSKAKKGQENPKPAAEAENTQSAQKTTDWEQMAKETSAAFMVALQAQQEAEAKRDEMQEQAVRLQADFENYRRRMQTENEKAIDDGFGQAIKAMLPIMDDLERAIKAAESTGADSILQGVAMARNRFFTEFAKRGLEEIAALDLPFDPNLHHAVLKEPCEDEKLSGTVCEIMQRGYVYKGRVLRYCAVKVYDADTP